MSCEQPGSETNGRDEASIVDKEEGITGEVLEWLGRFSPKMEKRLREARTSGDLALYREEARRVRRGWAAYRPEEMRVEMERAEFQGYLVLYSKVFGGEVALALPPSLPKCPPDDVGMPLFTVDEVLELADAKPAELAKVLQVKRLLPGSTVRSVKETVHEVGRSDDRRGVPEPRKGASVHLLREGGTE